MAVSNKLTMLIDLYKCRVSTSKNYGCIYGRIFRRKGLNLKGFAKHISEHGSLDIEYYNNERIKLRLNGMSPVQYRTQFQKSNSV